MIFGPGGKPLRRRWDVNLHGHRDLRVAKDLHDLAGCTSRSTSSVAQVRRPSCTVIFWIPALAQRASQAWLKLRGSIGVPHLAEAAQLLGRTQQNLSQIENGRQMRSYELRVAVELYSAEHRVPDTPLIASPCWIADQPVELRSLRLTLDEQPRGVAIDGCEAETSSEASAVRAGPVVRQLHVGYPPP